MKAISYACFKLEEKTNTSVKKKKSNFINVTGLYNFPVVQTIFSYLNK